MPSLFPTAASLLCGLSLSSEPPDYDEGLSEDTRVVEVETDRDGLDGQRRLDEENPGFGHSIAIEPTRQLVFSDELSEVLERSPGVRVRSLGGLGQFSAIQIRGSTPQQVQLFTEGVPLNGGMAGLPDLTGIPLDGLERVEIHRSYVPIAFGGAALGGAINFVGGGPETEASWLVYGGVGSFLTREAGVSTTQPVFRGAEGQWSLTAMSSYGGSKGNFHYFHDNGTNRISDDDTMPRRKNNDYNRVFSLLRLDGSFKRSAVSQQLRVNWREHGVPGRASTQSSETRQTLGDLRSITRLSRGGLGRSNAKIEWLAGIALGRRHYRDPEGQVGNGVDDQFSRAFDLYLSPRLTTDLWRGARLHFVADLRSEIVDIDEKNIPETNSAFETLTSGDAVRRRESWGVGFELKQGLFKDRWLLVPALRVDALNSHFRVPEGEGEVGDAGKDRTVVFFSPRMGTRVRVVKGTELRAGVGRYVRPPAMYELFGDRGPIVGEEGLKPEHGYKLDAGAVYDLQLGPASFYAQLSGFLSRTTDLIQFVPSGPVYRPENLPGALLRGVDGMLELRLFERQLEFSGEFTFLDSQNLTPESQQHGEALPGRPRLEGSFRAEIGRIWGVGWKRFEPRLGYGLDGISESALDPSGRYVLPARVMHRVMAQLHWAERVHLTMEVRNLADLRRTKVTPKAGPPVSFSVPVSDFIGYPLPGRSFLLRLSVQS